MKAICKVYADLATCGRRQRITSTHQVEAERCRIGKDDFFCKKAIKKVENTPFFA